MKSQNYLALKNLEVYRLSRKLSTLACDIYSKLNYEEKKIIGDQFIRATDVTSQYL